MLLDESIFCDRLGLLELLSGLAVHMFTEGKLEILPCGSYKSIFSYKIDDDFRKYQYQYIPSMISQSSRRDKRESVSLLSADKLKAIDGVFEEVMAQLNQEVGFLKIMREFMEAIQYTRNKELAQSNKFMFSDMIDRLVEGNVLRREDVNIFRYPKELHKRHIVLKKEILGKGFYGEVRKGM